MTRSPADLMRVNLLESSTNPTRAAGSRSSPRTMPKMWSGTNLTGSFEGARTSRAGPKSCVEKIQAGSSDLQVPRRSSTTSATSASSTARPTNRRWPAAWTSPVPKTASSSSSTRSSPRSVSRPSPTLVSQTRILRSAGLPRCDSRRRAYGCPDVRRGRGCLLRCRRAGPAVGRRCAAAGEPPAGVGRVGPGSGCGARVCL
jgi:hypothetical protein